MTAPSFQCVGGSIIAQPRALSEFDRAIREARSDAEIKALMNSFNASFNTAWAKAKDWARCSGATR